LLGSPRVAFKALSTVLKSLSSNFGPLSSLIDPCSNFRSACKPCLRRPRSLCRRESCRSRCRRSLHSIRRNDPELLTFQPAVSNRDPFRSTFLVEGLLETSFGLVFSSEMVLFFVPARQPRLFFPSSLVIRDAFPFCDFSDVGKPSVFWAS